MAVCAIKPTKPVLNEWGSAWISPQGEFFDVESCAHSKTAKKMFPGEANPSYRMEESGWVHLSFGDIIILRPHKLTQKQIDTLFDLVSKNANSYYVSHVWENLQYHLDR